MYSEFQMEMHKTPQSLHWWYIGQGMLGCTDDSKMLVPHNSFYLSVYLPICLYLTLHLLKSCLEVLLHVFSLWDSGWQSSYYVEKRRGNRYVINCTVTLKYSTQKSTLSPLAFHEPKQHRWLRGETKYSPATEQEGTSSLFVD